MGLNNINSFRTVTNPNKHTEHFVKRSDWLDIVVEMSAVLKNLYQEHVSQKMQLNIYSRLNYLINWSFS